ncbi:hypothetical protein CO172_00755 [Candidatus Uhrbacteria bacterium CG_4_9_14_3_um_filter_36_7]|uniref:EF-hand domain-containing protein n=1 Tax=Candidatus Uhrbacteria bacterium CG_4_9_14_3_um_filter_36_7 TaxID=1975033 RepID=A0A2M7XI55_9BACT|nr:MAG: hypothetical protein CO172_00755 [Candidatus Uhrbacteria bacterium CG_4_9_14_3_um_filter_36_7]
MFEKIQLPSSEPEDILQPADSIQKTSSVSTSPLPPVHLPGTSSLPALDTKQFDPDNHKEKKREPKLTVSEAKRPIPFWKIALLIMVGLFIILFAALFAYFLLTRSTKETIQMPEESPLITNEEVPQAQEPTTNTPIFETPPLIEEFSNETPPKLFVDTDKDGLTDEKEQALGTSPTQADTDGDGLFDREEVEVYKTDPLNPDTDGDGYLDGEEVKNGYNPKGSGKLFEISPSS